MATRVRTLHDRESRSLDGQPALAPQWESLARAAASPGARMLAAGLAIRVAFLTLARAYLFRDSFGFGFEAGRIARALAAGRGFSDPFHGLTGPTAWLAPVYPAVLAAIFKTFGTYSPLSGWVTLTFNSVCSAAVAPLLLALGREVFDERAGRWAGWTWAVLPYAVYWPTRVVWDTSLTGCLIAALLLLTLRLARDGSMRAWLGFGLAWGVTALTNPAALAVAPAWWAWAVWQQRRRGRLRWRAPVAAVALATACVLPWLARNARVLGAPVFIRDNFGAELRMGNGPSSNGIWMFWLHPTLEPRQLEEYRRLGERAYVAEQRREAIDFIRADPRAFAANTARRVYWFWCGTTKGEQWGPGPIARNLAFTASSMLALGGVWLLLRRRRPAGLLFAALLVCFPVVYYVTFVIPRYRHPIEPEMVLLAAGLISAARPRAGRGTTPSKAGAARDGEGARARLSD